MNKPFSLAFIGGGVNSAVGYAHFAAAQMDNLWSLDAGCFSHDPKINVQSANTYCIEDARCHSDLDTLLDKEANNIDALVILTPTPAHHDMAIKILQAGIPVICEKALAATSTEALDIAKLCHDKNGFLAVTYNYSGYPLVRELRRLITDGTLGDILHIQVEMPQEGYLRVNANGDKPNVQNWRLRDGEIPTIHLDLAVHLHELVYYLTNQKPAQVISDQSSFGHFDVVDNVNAMVRYDAGMNGAVWFSKSALGHRNGLRLRIYGSKASAEWYQLNPEELLLSHQNGRREILDRAANAPTAAQKRYERFKSGHPAGFVEALANLYTDIHEALSVYRKTGTHMSTEVYGADMAAEGLQFLEAMARSTTSRQWEKI